MSNTNKEVTEKLQKDCHNMVELIMKEKPNCTYQDATNIWMFNKLADLQNRLYELENTLTNKKQ